MGWSANKQLKGCGHRPNICSNIDRIRNKQQPNKKIEQPARVMLTNIGGEPLPGHPTNAGTNHLNTYHQRKGKECRPQHRIAKSSPSL